MAGEVVGRAGLAPAISCVRGRRDNCFPNAREVEATPGVAPGRVGLQPTLGICPLSPWLTRKESNPHTPGSEPGWPRLCSRQWKWCAVEVMLLNPPLIRRVSRTSRRTARSGDPSGTCTLLLEVNSLPLRLVELPGHEVVIRLGIDPSSPS